eukprot:jgi/Botrbrau1/20540/Bobra.145_2s0089.1
MELVSLFSAIGGGSGAGLSPSCVDVGWLARTALAVEGPSVCNTSTCPVSGPCVPCNFHGSFPSRHSDDLRWLTKAESRVPSGFSHRAFLLGAEGPVSWVKTSSIGAI